MSYLAKGRKEDLKCLAKELGEMVEDDFTIIMLRDKIVNSKNYEESFVKELFNSIINDRKQKEEQREIEKIREQENIEKERLYELEKLRLQASIQTNVKTSVSGIERDVHTVELQKLIPKFKPQEDDFSLFLTLFERQLRFLKIPENLWVTQLIGVLPSDITCLIAREPEEKAQNYGHVKEILLKRFKLTAEKFRQLFSQQRKSPEGTWKDFYFELRTYFEGWLKELKVDTYEKLKDLMIVDQIKKRCSAESREHFLDQWSQLISPNELVDKLDNFDSVRKNLNKKESSYDLSRKGKPKLQGNNSGKIPYGQSKNTYRENFRTNTVKDFRPSVTCYGCGAVGFIKAKCPTCSPCGKPEPP